MATTRYSDPSSSSSKSSRWNYDVFLSSRGEDTNKKFIDHLHTTLIHAGIHTLRDENELPKGEYICSQLLKAIQDSKISIVVFTKGYASSGSHLDELVQILDCKHTIGHFVLPIFYDVDPSDVRKQTGSFAEPFDRHEELFKGKVSKWREALAEAADLSGWDLKNVAKGHEPKFIEKIVNDVLNKLDSKYLNVAKHLVGMDSHVNKIIALLSMDSNDIRIVGVHGMGGIGKTSIAKALFNKLSHEFEGSCFLLNVKDMSEQSNGWVRLQEQLLCDILNQKDLKISNIDRGVILIKQRLCQKRVLVVLDDVDQLGQLNALVGERSCFGPGSRIIITTRDERLLTLLQVDEKYQATELSQDESVQLFSWHAFKENHPQEDYGDLSNAVVTYSRGLPLALEVLGSYLFKRSKPEWRSAIDKLQKIPHSDIQKKLRISFDRLDDDELKGIFLDIACFFVGMEKDYVQEILDARGFFPVIGINILIERSLITIDDQNKINMHDLLRDMGREIIRERSADHPGKRSRIWFRQDALDVLNKQMGTKAVEGLALDVKGLNNLPPLSTESFTKMRNLKLLKINGVHLFGCFKYLSKELLWLCWHGCPQNSLPSNFDLASLVVLDMQNSNIKELWKEIKFLHKIKILNLSYCNFLVRTPNFLGLSSLERLILTCCGSLIEVHPSIGHLESLTFLNLRGCWRLRNLPQSVCDLKCLETLDISMCSHLEKLPERLGDMESLTELLAEGTAIKNLPSSIGHLRNLSNLSLRGYKFNQNLQSTSWLSIFSSWLSPRSSNSKALLPTSFFSLSSLRKLDLSRSPFLEGAISIDLGTLCSLQELDLSSNKFLNLPLGINRLSKLEKLNVMFCANLLSISELPASLKNLHAYNCTSMERLSIQSKTVPSLSLSGCQKLTEIQGMQQGVKNTMPIFLDGCNNLSNNFKRSLVQALSNGEHYDLILPGSEIPDWFSYHADGPSLSFHVPAVSNGELETLIVWVVCAANERRFRCPFASSIIKNKSNGLQLFDRQGILPFTKICTDHSWVNHIPFTDLPCAFAGGEELELFVEIDNGIVVEKCGVHPIVKWPDVKDSQGTLMPYASSSSWENLDAARVIKSDKAGTKRGKDHEGEGEPCRDDEEGSSKRLKMEHDA